ncbi:sodium:solute symporter family protein [Marinigracilibium pacificum]|uniref:Na+:solute symporter n=1 Tax=Marinigracilibium pacificum TaxID=2729599 RepID=A0A848J0P9_9BACT|nr:sodium:solute symporter family protein [Marinigracilibium pacificum]NMM50137.1 Na+:solute symporter [Marinigracilibium pacificum]
MELEWIDWLSVALFFIVSLAIGVWFARSAGKSAKDFFLSGRNMPWWLLGISMVATTFSADTPNLVTEIVRTDGVAGNWTWWAFLLTGMLTVFVYAALWRKSEVVTDLEFYELRYSGKAAAFLRAFRAVYLGVFFNVMIMATVCLAAAKMGNVLLGLTKGETLIIAGVVTVIYSSLGGLKGVLVTDFIQFIIAMAGSVWAAMIIIDLPEVGGLSNLISSPVLEDKLDFIPDPNNLNVFIPVFLIPIAVQWWNVWYPGAEPGGGGYIVQRMLSAKDENNAVGATLFFNITHYALRPWPWILIGLASLLVFPDLSAIQSAFPNVDSSIIGHDLAYPAMLTYLPHGLLGVVVASLIAAFMSTISTHLNWGSSYVVYDFYQRFLKPEASEKELVMVGRISTVILMVLAMLFALVLESALEAFQILLTIGAGTGLIFILRWFWWRINAWSEITGMAVSFIVAIYFNVIHDEFFTKLESYQVLLISITITTIAWVTVTLLTRPTDHGVLVNFVKKINPGGIGWNKIYNWISSNEQAITYNKNKIPLGIAGMLTGTFSVYSALFAVGYWLYGNIVPAVVLTGFSIVCFILMFRIWGGLRKIDRSDS